MLLDAELLSLASAIKQKHETIADITGERFNVFRILGLETRENRTHSAFIRELLDPKGSHGQKATFLKSFIRILNIKGFQESCLSDAVVSVERHLGFVTDDYSEGGRIDIVIEPVKAGTRIFIENKIHAGDQQCQLIRYHNHNREAHLLYLTLHGEEATEWSTTDSTGAVALRAGEHYFPISYKSHILCWLEECKKESIDHPLLRETIAQYINLIRHLTQQSISQKMDKEINELLLGSTERFASAKKIAQAYNSISNGMKEFLRVEIQKTVETPHNIGAHKFSSGLYFEDKESYISIAIENSKRFSSYQRVFEELGFRIVNNGKLKYAYKYCSYYQDEAEFFRLCQLSHEDAFSEVLLEYKRYVDEFKNELLKHPMLNEQ